ncbi:MAG: hypothetical protein A2161_08360 [Candidatus Schekmanbacteria bacterium RBG_13_48_7]|uniref:Plasmid maintenance system killer protein n=1 Tax=Candidatus Schekmanbacteria bacterium RBG_13_48_7 TaxID=1817878 RepID=A0A1F7S687_9BACT|nr:MAG: hypothetical protein A2161_08360 [Candidatus Schekmanbacteria bacterium RBG_13_48_7]
MDSVKPSSSNRLHSLKGTRKGLYSISISEQWHICFRFIKGDAFDVEIAEKDFHNELNRIRPLNAA